MMMSNLLQTDVRKMKNKSHQILSFWSKVIFLDLKLNMHREAEGSFMNSGK